MTQNKEEEMKADNKNFLSPYDIGPYNASPSSANPSPYDIGTPPAQQP